MVGTSFRAFLEPLRQIESELRVVAHMPVGNLASVQQMIDLNREQALGMVAALRGLVWAGRNESDDDAPTARFYIGKDSWYEGIPARDLTQDEYARLTKEQRALVDNGGLYSPAKPARSKG